MAIVSKNNADTLASSFKLVCIAFLCLCTRCVRQCVLRTCSMLKWCLSLIRTGDQHHGNAESDYQPMAPDINRNNDCETRGSEGRALGNDAAAAVGLSNQQNGGIKLELYVKYKSWWAVPSFLSDEILTQWIRGAQFASFIWDWEDKRIESYRPEGADTSIN